MTEDKKKKVFVREVGEGPESMYMVCDKRDGNEKILGKYRNNCRAVGYAADAARWPVRFINADGSEEMLESDPELVYCEVLLDKMFPYMKGDEKEDAKK